MTTAHSPSPATPKSEIQERIANLQRRLRDQELDGALILQTSDLFYFSATIQQAHLYVPADGESLLMVRKSLERARAESPLEHIIPITSPKKLAGLIQDQGLRAPRRLGLELDVLPANLYLMLQAIFKPEVIADISPQIRQIRAVKSEYEIDLIRQSAKLADQVAAKVPALLRPGIPEIELAGLLEAEARRLGHQGIVRMRMWGGELFYGHLMAGPSGAVPSYLSSPTGGTGISAAVAQSAGMRPIEPHEPVLVDYVFVHNGYMADHTRIFSIGELPRDLLDAHQSMLDLQEQIKGEAKPGIRTGDLYDLAIKQAAKAGYADFFMGADPMRIRFIGHGIGLELDEFPFLAQGQDMVLEAGMIIALEPKLIFPGRGVVGIENTHLVTPQGLMQLTQAVESIQTI